MEKEFRKHSKDDEEYSMNKVIYFEKQERKKRLQKIVIRFSYRAMIIFAVFIIFSVFTVFRMKYDEIANLKKIEQEKKQEVMLLSQKIEELEEKVQELNTPEGIEKLARIKLNMVKKGEKILRPVTIPSK
ncbi:MAG: hypothetical protein C0601_08995 [Candidatus Muiribacterium halophilum]|uniref:Cell division protein FtsL n=1 Tax=Muiribacterium halophilum TaxID=2053465 RepID=A0A2N5ZDV9_MUIH1|nr:MAG: hypothetical protein C0601_08995 [Candidatus Muirbacterium halophilum]